MKADQSKTHESLTALMTSTLYAFPSVSMVFATVVELLPRNGLFTFGFPLLISFMIGLLNDELSEVITRVFLTWIFFACEMLLVLNLPIFVGVIKHDTDLWLVASMSLTFRLTLFTAPSILIGSFFGVFLNEYYFK